MKHLMKNENQVKMSISGVSLVGHLNHEKSTKDHNRRSFLFEVTSLRMFPSGGTCHTVHTREPTMIGPAQCDKEPHSYPYNN